MRGHRKILIVAHPGQGHINPSLRLANRLIRMGVKVTFSTSLSVVNRIDKKTSPRGLTYAPFSDGHDDGKQPTITLQQFFSDVATYGYSAVEEIISSATAAGEPFDHLIYTTGMPWASALASAHNVKSTLLWCQSATILDIYYYYFNGYQDLISYNSNNTTFPINLPGLPPLTMADMPSFFLPSRPNEHDFLLPLVKDHFDVLKMAPRILINTFNELETESIGAIDKLQLLPIGPLLPPEILDRKGTSENSSTRGFIEKPVEEYIRWLDTNKKSSVVYVSFGSLATLTMDQAEEVATGLLDTHRPFLWVIRDIGEAAQLRKIKELKEHGMIVSWCSQVEVLSHEAIGCFVTHCGWNSTIETLATGVPVVAFPQWSDQETNAKMIEDVWRTGIRLRRRREGDGVVEGKEIKRCVEMVMEDNEKKRNAEKWSKLATEALNNGGLSTINLQAFLDDA